MKKCTLILFILLAFIGYTQTVKTTNQHKFGLGLGYNINSEIGDSIHPVEISLRYQLNNKLTIQLYAPLSLKKSSIRNEDETRKQTLYGIGIGYDYIVYSYTHFIFFAGLSTDYQWYQNRWDFHRVEPQRDWTYYEWNKIKRINIKPNIGLRLSFDKIIIESKMNLFISRMNYEKYAYSFEIFPASRMESRSYFPEDKFSQLQIGINPSLNISYYF